MCDIYQPTGDTAKLRPLMIYLPTGNFLPKAARRQPLGSRTDSCAVEFCNRFAKLGYVTVAADYRQGWNPIASQQTDRIFGLINAAYRGIQDGRAAIRYFKANAAALKIDTNRIMVIGENTGAYIAYGMASADKYNKFLTTQYPQGKFTVTTQGGAVVPMVTEIYNGNIWGTAPDTATRAPSGYPAAPVGDTLNVPNLPANTSNYQFTVALNGAMGDITWLDAATTPIVTIGFPYNTPAAPYHTGVLGVAIGGGVFLPVLEVQGANWVGLKADSLGVNNAFKKIKAASDPYKSIVTARQTAIGAAYASGLFPIIGQGVNDVGPYQWWSKDTTIATNKFGLDSASLANNPNMGPLKARLYIDTLMTFILPRACVALNLPCASVVSSTEDLLRAETTKLTIAPNPANDYITFESEVYNPMKAIELYDMSGRLVKQAKVDANYFNMARGLLPSGIYIAKVKFEGGILSKKVIFEKE